MKGSLSIAVYQKVIINARRCHKNSYTVDDQSQFIRAREGKKPGKLRKSLIKLPPQGKFFCLPSIWTTGAKKTEPCRLGWAFSLLIQCASLVNIFQCVCWRPFEHACIVCEAIEKQSSLLQHPPTHRRQQAWQPLNAKTPSSSSCMNTHAQRRCALFRS